MLLLTGCGPIPVQMQSSKQEQTQRQSNEQTQSAEQQSAHQSESKQGTNSMPVIIICNTNNSAGAGCATFPKENPLQPAIKKQFNRETQ
jgi:starvation-inducible outer membrane lipoprotein